MFVYGGWVFLKGAWRELADRNPGMMTLIGLAISVAFIYSGIGYIKGIVLVMPRWRAGLETLLMGGAAAGIAFLFGYFLEPLLAGLDIQ